MICSYENKVYQYMLLLLLITSVTRKEVRVSVTPNY